MQSNNTPQEAIAKLTANKTSIAYSASVKAINSAGSKIHMNTTSGRGRFTSISNHLQKVMDQLALTGVTYTIGNDAPKGGRMGDFVIVISL